MIPKLYDQDRALLEYLADATVCEVTEERNGIYELYLKIPTAAPAYQSIKNDCWIKARPSDGSPEQMFRVYRIEKELTGTAVSYAEHESYLLNSYPVDSVDVTGTATAAMNAMLDRARATIGAHGFSAVSDVDTSTNYANAAASVRAMLGGEQGSILQRYGGEFEFDGRIIRLHKQRGRETGVRIEYAKNMTKLKAKIDTGSTYTGLFPFIKTDKSSIFLPERVLWVENRSGIQRRVKAKDFSEQVGENPTEAKLRAAAESYLRNNSINAIDISMDVEFAPLWQSPEWDQYKDLERVVLCDIITIHHRELDVDISAKVVETVYDSLGEKYVRLTVGAVRSNMSSALAKMREEIFEVMLNSSQIQALIDQAVDDATNAITGNSGGKVILHPALNPQEILILQDANDSIQTAQRLWRWNAGGLGYSTNGYNGPFRTAITADGQIVADFISTGVLVANVIKAGILSDAVGRFSLNMATGAASLSGATITDGRITITGGGRSTVIDSNGITTNFATITGGIVSIGGSAFRTEISAGQIRQFALGDGTQICTMTPLSQGNEYRPSIYVGSNSRITGFAISHQLAAGGIVNIANFDKNKVAFNYPIVLTGGSFIRYRATYGPDAGRPVLEADTWDNGLRAASNGFTQFFGGTAVAGQIDLSGMIVRGSYWANNGSILVGSKEEIKEDILPVPNALDIIAEADICSYELKLEGEEIEPPPKERTAKNLQRTRRHKNKRHYGLVIGKGHKTPDAVIADTGEHIDLYSMAALGWKGIQEILTRLEALERR